MKARYFLLLILLFQSSCALNWENVTRAPEKTAQSDQGIYDAIIWYLIAATDPCGEEISSVSNNWLNEVLNDFGEHFRAKRDEHVSEDVQQALCQDKAALDRLFGTDPERGLEADFRVCAIEIVYPSQALRDADSPALRNLPRDVRKRIQQRIDPSVQAPKARVVLALALAPGPIDLRDAPWPKTPFFKSNRQLHLTKGATWRVISHEDAKND